ncbi:MAG: hypothetical protein OXM03_07385, partial [Chloroflexota bacterium]|nr:hypothetical protein [Chloroflexota bacterium]
LYICSGFSLSQVWERVGVRVARSNLLQTRHSHVPASFNLEMTYQITAFLHFRQLNSQGCTDQ